MTTSTLEGLLRRDRQLVWAGLAATAGLAWAYQLYMAWGMEHLSPGMAAIMPNMQLWRAWDLVLLFTMWAVMMVAMMVPTAAPTVLLFAEISRKRAGTRSPFAATSLFLAGYVAAWTAFSLVATLAQWQLHRAAFVSAEMETTTPWLAGALLLATGLFQFTPWKDACLSRCRSPLAFVLGHWREGGFGAFRTGFLNGIFCVGCCALLMALLFVNGVMNIVWMAILTAFVLVEKLAPLGKRTAQLGGMALCAWGAWVLLSR